MHAVKLGLLTLMSPMARNRSAWRANTIGVLDVTPGMIRMLALGRPTPGARTRSARVSDVAARPVSANVCASIRELVLNTNAPYSLSQFAGYLSV